MSLHCGRTYGHQRLTRENNRTLRHRPDITCKFKGTQIIKKLLTEAALLAQVGNIVLIKVQIVDVLNHLLKACGNGIAAVIGVGAIKHVKVRDGVAHTLFKVAVCHRHFIIVKQHREIT